MNASRVRPRVGLGLWMAAGFAGLWSVSITRAVGFYGQARELFRETGSMNASEDLRFAGDLLTSYGLSLLAAWTLAWLVARRPHVALVLPAVVLAAVAVRVWKLHPEAPIHLFPTMSAWQPAEFSVAALGFGLFIARLGRGPGGNPGSGVG